MTQPLPDPPRLKILVSGASGLIGAPLCARLAAAGHRVVRLVRGAVKSPDEIGWDPAAGRIDPAVLEQAGLDAVIHLAGESIAAGRWTAARKARILSSRVEGTWLLCEALAGLQRPPRVLLTASAVGFYGDRGAEPVDESSPPGRGFLAEVSQAWEAATEPARRASRPTEPGGAIRVVHLRLAMVLAPAGGALAKMLPPFRLGLGGPIGSGRQYVPWIALDDALAAFEHALANETLAGPVNFVAPEAVTQREFARALGRALRRPAMLPLPAWAARLALGEMAGPLLLEGARVVPARLIASGFQFRYGRLESALAHILSSMA